MTADSFDGETQDPSITAKLAELLSQAPALFGRLGAVARRGVLRGSRAAEDGASPLGHHVRVLATDHLSIGIEHLVIWHRLLMAGVQPYAAHMTLIRGAMEGAVMCRWLVQQRTDSPDRVRRGVALLLDDYRERRAFEQEIGVTADRLRPPAKTGTDRLTELQRERDRAGIGRTEIPKMTALFGAYAVPGGPTGRALYRLLSAYAHGKQWKGLTTRFRVVEDVKEVPGVRLVQVTANDDLAVVMTAVGLSTAALALAELETYLGHETAK